MLSVACEFITCTLRRLFTSVNAISSDIRVKDPFILYKSMYKLFFIYIPSVRQITLIACTTGASAQTVGSVSRRMWTRHRALCGLMIR